VQSRSGAASYDHVVLACHSDQACRLLVDADADERGVIGKVSYQPNRAWLHTDDRLMPASRRVWSSWNYMSEGGSDPAVSVTYLLNKLQPLPFSTPVFVSLNPAVEPRAEFVLGQFDYTHSMQVRSRRNSDWEEFRGDAASGLPGPGRATASTKMA
jgi:predicted NAD/FAD-binding protein